MQENIYIVSIDKNLDRISDNGKKFYDIIKNKNQVFNAFIHGENLYTDVTEYKQKLFDKGISLYCMYNKYYWASDLECVKNKVNKRHTFIFISSKQLEFDF